MNKFGDSALTIAVSEGHFEVVKSLVEHGAEISDEMIAVAEKRKMAKIAHFLKWRAEGRHL